MHADRGVWLFLAVAVRFYQTFGEMWTFLFFNVGFWLHKDSSGVTGPDCSMKTRFVWFLLHFVRGTRHMKGPRASSRTYLRKLYGIA